MSYLLPSTTVDDLVLMLAARDGAKRPGPWLTGELDHLGTYERRAAEHVRSIRPPIQARGDVWLNITDAAMEAVTRLHLAYESPNNFRVMHLTWKGWDRVEGLLAAGRVLPTDEELSEYARQAMAVVERGEPDPGAEPVRRSWWRRLLRLPVSSPVLEGGKG